MTRPAVDRVSVIMPVWQPDPSWFRQAVSSVLNQEGCAVELIVVDDGNAAPVSRLLNAFSDVRLSIMRVAHAGPNAARNAGLAAATGDWIRFADADDVLPGDSTKHLLALTRGTCVIAYGATMVADIDLRPKYLIAAEVQGNAVEPCLLGRFHTRLPALLFPRCVVEKAGPWDPAFRVSGDWDFVLRAVEQAPVVGDQRIGLHYRRHVDSVTGTADVAMGEGAREQVIRKYFDRHPEQRGTRLERRARTALWLDCGFQYWRSGRYRRAASRLSRAMGANPVGTAVAVSRFTLRQLRHSLETHPTRHQPSAPRTTPAA